MIEGQGFVGSESLRTTNAKSSYIDSRKWADSYDPHMGQIACGIIFNDPKLMDIHFIHPTNYEDRKLGIDQYIRMPDVKMSYRVRKPEDKQYWEEGFTIRTSAKYGKSELEKIKEGIHARYLLYALAHPTDYGIVDRAALIDLYSVAAQLKHWPLLFDKATHKTGFVEFPYDLFPHPVVVGTWNCIYKKH